MSSEDQVDNLRRRSVGCNIKTFDIHSSNLDIAWKQWSVLFTIYLRAADLEDESDSRKVALLLHHLGNDIIPIFTAFNVDLDTVSFASLFKKFGDYFSPKKNITYERFKLFSRKQSVGETLNEFVTSLQNLSLTCDLGVLRESLVKDVLINGLHTNNTYIREKLLMDDPISITEALRIASAMESSKEEAKLISEPVISINKLQKKVVVKNDLVQENKSNKLCRYCGTRHTYRSCPAYGTECSTCHRKNHFSTVCKSSVQMNQVKAVDEIEIFIGNLEVNKKECWEISLKILDEGINCLVDTGAEANLMGIGVFQQLGLKKTDITASPIKLNTLAGNIPSLGYCTLPCVFHNNLYHLRFFITTTRSKTILGFSSAKQIGLLKQVNSISLKQFSDVFSGLGCIKGIQVNLETNPNVRPKIDPPRRIPYKLTERLRKELDRMVELNVIVKVDKPTSWVSSLVVVEKEGGKLRVCIDPRNLNEAILRPRRYIPDIESIKAQLSGSVKFSTLDAFSGFWVLQLNERSSDLTCFNTPFGRYKFLRLPFGISASPEIFQNIMSEEFSDIPGVIIYIDDFLIHGKTEQEHDERLRLVLERARKIGLRFNEKKCQFNQTSVKYLGHIFNTNGMSIDPSRIEAIEKLESPTSKEELQRFLGMVNYIGSFLKNLSLECSNLRQLLKKDVPWQWNKSYELEFNHLKEMICKAPVLQYFDLCKPVRLSVDSSKDAIGCVILQDNLPIAYASSSLSDCQSRWAQIEKELLAIWFGCQKFNQYLYGQDVIKVETDHKPLVTLFKKAFDKIPSRLQRLMIKLQKYQLQVEYVPGKLMFISDTLSRAKYRDNAMNESDVIDKELNFQVNLLFTGLAISKEKLKEIEIETLKDNTLQQLKIYCLNDWPSSKNQCHDTVKPYYSLRDEISVNRNILFLGSRVIVPSTLRKMMTDNVHEGHFGIEKCINLAKQVLYWPNMSVDIKNKVESCEVCLQYRRKNVKQPLLPHEPVFLPFEKIAIDFCDFEDKKLMIVVDYYSGFFEFVFLNSLQATVVIQHLKSILARHGIPVTIMTDNGPPFASAEFANFAKDWGFNHTTSSPCYPRSNGLVEKTVDIVKKILFKARKEKKDHFLALLHFRNAERKGIYSPAQLLFSRNLRTKLPCTRQHLVPKLVVIEDYMSKIEKKNQQMKKYFDRNTKVLTDVALGDEVMFKKNPDLPWLPGKILAEAEEPRSFVVQDVEGGGIYRRNREHILDTSIVRPDTDVDVVPDEVISHDVVSESAQSIDLPTVVEQTRSAAEQTRSGRLVKLPKRFTFAEILKKQ